MTIQQQMHMIFYAIPAITQGIPYTLPCDKRPLLRISFSAKISLDRLNAFLHDVCSPQLDILSSSLMGPTLQTELLDRYEEVKQGAVDTARIFSVPEPDTIGINETTFTWTSGSGSQTHAALSGTTQRNFALNIDELLLFKRGQINLVVGPTGSGKTSVLMTLLGEMHYIPSGPDSWVNLPREGGVAYAAQESWVLNETIKVRAVFVHP